MSTNDTTTQNLLFLLAAVPLGLGCIIVTDDGNDTEGGTSSPTTGGPTTGATGTDTTPATGEGTGEGTGGSTAADPTGAGSTSAGSTSADSTGADSTTGAPTSPCADYGEHAIKCQVPYADYLSDSCYYNLTYQEGTSDECGVAFLEYVACLSELSCQELMGDAPCQAELDALLAMGCPTVEL